MPIRNPDMKYTVYNFGGGGGGIIFFILVIDNSLVTAKFFEDMSWTFTNVDIPCTTTCDF